jgi:hypothetical protein
LSLAPKWAKPAALLGLRLNILLAAKRGDLTPEELVKFVAEADRIEAMKD